ncbi:MAG: TonB-dependent receptor [Acidobacteriota bacterium]
MEGTPRRLPRPGVPGAAGGFLLVAALAGACLAPSSVSAQTPARPITGRVTDTAGAPVRGAVGVVDTGSADSVILESDGSGCFEIASPPAGTVSIRVTASGFADASLTVEAGSAGDRPLQFVLRPAPFTETVSVTATRGAPGLASPAAVSTVTSAELATSPSGALDDALRGTPGFSLFRRSSSRVANPTTQGVTLRGVSGSGASRTLVLADGVPLNDPFGSWVYWNRVPAAAIDRVEVVRGASGDLYGADALGGVIQILAFPPGRSRVRAALDGGSHGTLRGSAYAGVATSDWTFSGAGEWQGTDGVPIVAADERGPVDVPAYSRYRTGFASVTFNASAWRAGVTGSAQVERRGNGTPVQVNDTTWRQIAGSVAGPGGGGLWSVQIAAGTQTYFQTFSAVNASRTTERQTSEQRIPTSFVISSGTWARSLGRHTLLFGADARRVEATLRETRYSLAGAPLAPTETGGTEAAGALFARVSLSLSDSLSVDAGLRTDVWRTTPKDEASGVHRLTTVSPRVSAVWRASRGLATHIAFYQASRTPTLNELYRGFRVGNVVTNANPRLEPERLTGVEGGVLLGTERTSARISAFYSRLTDAVTNVTILTTPTQVLRQRQNTDTVRVAGVEAEIEARVTPSLSVSGTAVLTASHFVQSPAQPDIEGNRLPQVPRVQLGASLTWTEPRLATVVLNLRAWGAQFDDDQNMLELRPYGTVDVLVSRNLSKAWHVFGAVENLFDVEYDVGRTPVRTVGWPRSARLGVRFAFR